MVLRETQLIITSGNATSTNFMPGALQGIPTGTQAIRGGVMPNNQVQVATNTGGVGTPFGSASNFNVSLPQAFENVVKTELRYFFMENGINNIYPSSAASLARGVGDGNNTFYILQSVNIGPEVDHKLIIPAGYYDRNALAEVILNLANQINPALGTTQTITTPSMTNSNPIFNTQVLSGNVAPALNFSACSIGPDGIFRLESDNTTTLFGNDWGIAFQVTGQPWFPLTQYLLGFQETVGGGSISNVDFYPTGINGIQMLESPYTTTIDIYNYILIQSQKLGSRCMSTTGVESYAVVPMSGQSTQVAAETGQFTYDGGNFTLDSNYFNTPRRLDNIDIRLADSDGQLLDIGQNTITIVLRIVQSVV